MRAPHFGQFQPQLDSLGRRALQWIPHPTRKMHGKGPEKPPENTEAEVRNVGADFGVIYDTNYGLKWTNMPSFNHRWALARMCPLMRRGGVGGGPRMGIKNVRHKLINLFSHSLHALLANMFMQNYCPCFGDI